MVWAKRPVNHVRRSVTRNRRVNCFVLIVYLCAGTTHLPLNYLHINSLGHNNNNNNVGNNQILLRSVNRSYYRWTAYIYCCDT